ncbi:MAG: hypothetical protein Q8K79_15060 [Solirubrobacteraceae bacterium]|nr:hypothetical protein [Solirubrobacteraceae bacterium]
MTERGTDSISTYAVDERGLASGPTTIGAAGRTPYGFGPSVSDTGELDSIGAFEGVPDTVAGLVAA